MLNTSAYSVSRKTSGAVSLRARGEEALSLDHIRAEAPSIFADRPHDTRSERFTFIPTSEILGGLMRAGFVPVAVSQGGSRQEGKADFTKHSIRLRRRGHAPAIVGRSDRLYPEITLYNAHDGTSAYKLIPAAFRVECANGLVTSRSLGEQKVPHKGDVMNEVIEGAFRVLDTLPRVVETAQRWSEVRLSAADQMAYAEVAALARWPAQELDGQTVQTSPIEPARLLRAQRLADGGADLWSTFNRVQEGLIRGGQRYEHVSDSGRRSRRKVGAVGGVDDNRRINQMLWQLTERLAELKG